MKSFIKKCASVHPIAAFGVGIVLGAVATQLLLFSDFDKATPTVVITYTNDGYTPDTVFINQGTIVRFVNESDIDFWPASNLHPEHAIYPEFDTKESLPPGTAWEFVFDKVGPWHFHDHLKAHNIGIVYVFDEDNHDIEALCTDIKTERTCMVNYLYKIVETKGPTVAMDTVRDLYSSNELRAGCHKTTHDIGHVTYALHGYDFELTESLILCTAGFFHGVMEGRISETGDPAAAVEWCTEATKFYEGMYKDFEARCAHGVGHGIGESMLTEFDNDWQRFKELTEEAAEQCGIYDETELFRVVCESGVYSVVIDWIIATEQEEHYFNLDEAPYAFCADLKTETMTQECVWEFSQRLQAYHESMDEVFIKLDGYLQASNLLEEYGEWAARAAGHQLAPIYIHDEDDRDMIATCRVPNEVIEKGCFSGTLEGFVASGIWREEYKRAQRYCSHEAFSPDEQAWCQKYFDGILANTR